MTKDWIEARSERRPETIDRPTSLEADLSPEREASTRQLASYRSAEPASEAEANRSGVDDALELADRSAGGPVDDGVRARLEQTLGGDLSGVRVHDDAASNRAAGQLGAEAFTIGQDIYFGTGKYQPGSPAGEDLLAHEAAHALQQTNASGTSDGVVSSPSDAVEQEAEGAVAAHRRGERAAVATTSSTAISRKAIMAKPAGDWDAAGPAQDPKDFLARVAQEPAIDEANVRLGSTWSTRYLVTNPPPKSAGIAFSWQHRARGATVVNDASANEGPSSNANFLASHVGDAAATTFLTQHGPDKRVKTIEGPQTTLKVAKPEAKIVNMYSESERGQVPVTTEMQIGETLHLEVHVSNLDQMLTQGTASFGGGMIVKNVRGIGNGIFKVTLAPSKVGKVDGALKIMPGRAKEGDVVGDRLTLAVGKMSDRSDYGKRPMDTKDALGRLERAWAQVYRDRVTGVETAFNQMKEKDPPPKTPLWKAFLIGAAKMALDAATAGLGARFAAGAMELMDHEGEGLKEFVKNIAEKSMNTLVEQSAGGTLGTPDSGGYDYNGIKLSLANKFYSVQKLTLSAAETEQVNSFMTSATDKAQTLDQKQTDGFENTGEGYKLISAMAHSVGELAGSVGQHEQYQKTFQAWCALIAQNSVGSTKPASTEEEADPTKATEHGTNLSKIVDADNIVGHTVGSPDGRVSAYDAKGLDKAPGVLRLELRLIPHGGNAPKYAGLIDVKNARISGLDNDAFASTVTSSPIKDLDMPIIASLNDNDHSGFVVGRNEVKAYWASSAGSDTLTKRYNTSPEDAARKLLDEELGSRRLPSVERD